MRRETGFSILAAIFLLVVLALLGALIASVTGMQQSSGQLDVLGVRAYHSARAGIEWGASQVLDPNNNLPGFGGTDNLPPCPGASTDLTGLGGSLSSFTVTVTCSATINAPTTEGNRKIGAYRIVSTACNQAPCPNPSPTNGYVERQIQATLSKCKDPSAAPPRFACN
jgi:MSHA biogenesis protein MshP